MSQAPSGFDPQQFLQAQITEVNERRNPLPVQNPETSDGKYLGVIGTIKTDSGTIEKGDRAGQPWLAMLVPIKIDVPSQLQQSLKLPPTLTLTDRVFIDLTADGKGIDNAPGRNRRQKEYREALDLNKPGDVWSWQKAEGQVVKVELKHRMTPDGYVSEDIQESRLSRR